MCRQHAEVPSPGVALLISLAAHAQIARLASVRSSYTLLFGFKPGDTRDGSFLATPPFVGPFARSVGAQSTTQA